MSVFTSIKGLPYISVSDLSYYAKIEYKEASCRKTREACAQQGACQTPRLRDQEANHCL
jgi:hypothetical protein